MKNFKEFKSEQQYVTEIGPIAATLMGAMALWGGYKAYKGVKAKIKGYKETKAEKKKNKDAGVFIDLKVFNSETGKMDTETEKIAAAGTRGAAMSDDDRLKIQKKKQKAKDSENLIAKNAWQEKEKKAVGKRKGIEDVGDAEEYFKNKGTAPDGWADTRTRKEKEDGVDFKGKIMTRADAAKEKKRQRKVGAIGRGGKDTSKPAPAETESTMLKFGEFIAEDIIKDLKKASKSKKDVEISLDDGADIPIDPMTAEIFVKYIEGLSSSEKNKTIKQIQRTERGFMKVLGKAHEG